MRIIVWLLILLLSVSVYFNWFLYQSAYTSKHTDTEQPIADLTSLQIQPVNARQAQYFFEKLQFETAFTKLHALKSEHSEYFLALKQAWFEQSKNWLIQKNIEQFDAVLPHWQADITTQSEYQRLRFDFSLSQLDMINAADALSELQSHLSPNTIVDLQNQFNTALELKITELKNLAAWQTLTDLLQDLHWYQPENHPLSLALSQAYIQLDEYGLAEQLLIYLVTIEQYQTIAQRLLDNLARPDNITVALDKLGEHYLLAARINQTVSVSLMLDTGASITTITRSKFEQISQITEYRFLRNQIMSTAGGKVDSEVVEFNQFEIAGLVHLNFMVAVIDMPESKHYDGLLGMNFLSSYEFVLDQENEQLLLK